MPFLTAAFLAALQTAGAPATIDDNSEEILVTGTRVPVRAEDLTSAVSVLTAEDLELRQITRVVDALKALPGVAVARGGGIGGTTQLRLRGAEANHVLVIIDGIEVNDPAAGDEFQFEHLALTEIERIELIRGPMSTVWGSDALAGVINITTKSGASSAGGRVRAEAGSFGTVDVGASLRDGGESWHASAGVDVRSSDGVNASRVGDEADGYENMTLNARAGVSLSPAITLDASLRYEDARSEFDATDFTTSLPGDSDDVTETEKLYAGLTARATLVDGVLTQTARATYLDSLITNTSFGNFNGSTASEKWSFYADTVITPIEGQTISLLFDHEDTEFAQRGNASFFGDPNQDRSLSVTGFGASYVGTFADILSLNAAIRYDDNSDFRDFTSWRAGMAVKATDQLRIFAGVARGQKAPTVIERFGFFTNFAGNADVQPENSIQWEVGLDYTVSDRVSITVTGFLTRLENEINGFVFDPTIGDFGGFTVANIADRSTRDGLEVSFEAQPTDQLSIVGQYSYVNSKEASGAVLEVRRPNHQAFLGLQYQASSDFRLSVDLDYTGRAFDNFFDPVTFAAERVTLQNYLLVRVAGDYKISDAIRITARAENLLDQRYEDILGFNTPGLGAYAGLRFDF